MFVNISILVLKSGKGSGNAATFPAVARMLLRGRRFRDLFRWSCSPFLSKTFINKLPRLASAPLAEVVLQTLSIQSRDFEEIFSISTVYLTPTVNVGKTLYLYSIIKKATKGIENLFCSLPGSTMVALPCCGQVGKNAVRLLFDFKLNRYTNVY